VVIKTAEVDNNKIRYLEEGSSENTLLLLHGLGASAERWEYVIPHFAREFRVVVPDPLLALGIVTNQWLIIQLNIFPNSYQNL